MKQVLAKTKFFLKQVCWKKIPVCSLLQKYKRLKMGHLSDFYGFEHFFQVKKLEKKTTKLKPGGELKGTKRKKQTADIKYFERN